MKVIDILMQLSTCGYKILEEDQVHTLTNGVDKDYDLGHATISRKFEPMTMREVQAMLLIHEK